MRAHGALLLPALCAFAAPVFAGIASRRFNVGATVVHSATVIVTRTTASARIRQVTSRGSPPPMLQVGSTLESTPVATWLSVQGGDTIVTLHY